MTLDVSVYAANVKSINFTVPKFALSMKRELAVSLRRRLMYAMDV